MIVQVLVPFGPKLFGAQLRDVGVVDATRLMLVVVEMPFSVAVSVALWLVLSAPVVAAKVPVADPAATVTEAGTVNPLAVLASVAVTPPVGAA